MKLELVADRDEPAAGQIFLDVAFDGQSRRCFLDTGASTSKVVAEGQFSAYPAISEKPLIGLGGKPISVARIQVAKTTVGQEELGAHEIMRVPAELAVEDTAGIDLFKDKQVTFNFKTQALSFSRQQPSGQTSFEVSSGAHMVVPVMAGHLKMRMIWDTGAGLTTVDQKVVEAHPKHFRLLRVVDVGDTVSSMIKLKLYEADEIRVGKVVLRQVQVLAADFSTIQQKLGDPGIVGALGFNVLTKFDWHFDMPGKKFDVE